MLELGPDEERLHREIGALAAARADAIVAVGARGAWIAEGAAAAGARASLRAEDADEAAASSSARWRRGSATSSSLKGSRGIGLDRTVDLLAEARA